MSIRLRTFKQPNSHKCDGCGRQPYLQIVLTTMLGDTPAAMSVDLCRRCYARLQKLIA